MVRSNEAIPNPDVVLTFDIAVPVPIVLPEVVPRPRLAHQHLEELRASGISDELIAASGIRTVSGMDACQMLKWSRDPGQASPGWAIPFDDPNAPDCYWRIKFDHPRVVDGRKIKYESPVGGGNRAYLPPGFDGSKGKQIVVTEGEKKALSAIAHGVNCLGLTGCWNWQKPRKRDDAGRGYGPRHLIDDLTKISWANRDVIICFDSDVAEKHSVELAQQRLAEALAKRGANVRVARLPNGPDGGKLGLDDAIVELGVHPVMEILEAAEEPELPKLYWPDLARMLIEDLFSLGVDPTLRYWRDAFWRWSGRHYEGVDERTIINEAYRFLERIAWQPTRNKAAEVVAALKAEIEVDGRIEPPCRLHHSDPGLPGTPLVFANGVGFVDFDEWTWGKSLVGDTPSPNWFCTGSREFDYDPRAKCPTWEAFLASSLPDADAQRLLRQWFGYLLSGRLDQHKLLVLLGAIRAGKSIIASTMGQIVGKSATATSTLKSLGEDFGLWPLVGKQLLLIPDAQDRGSCLAAVERLKAISGCDGLSVNRKHLPILNNVHLQTRIVITCNQLPRFLDVSGALHCRLLVVNFEISFAGREDRTLPDRIRQELPGIFNWALSGWMELRLAGQFTEPQSSQDVLAEAAGVFSPISAFLDECCEVDPNKQVAIDDLWTAWQLWCKQTGHHPGSRSKLGTDLRGCLPGIKRTQLRCGGSRPRLYHGLELNDHGKALQEEWRRTAYRRA